MAVKPLLALVLSQVVGGTDLFRTLGPVVEALGFVSFAVLSAVGAAVSFNYGAKSHF